MAVYTPEIECASRDYLHAVQSARLLKMVRTAYEKVPFYKRKFDEIGLQPGDIHSIDDITKLPFTVKTDLRDNYPFGLFAVPQGELVRIHASSGTTGKQTVVGYTAHDIDIWAEGAARALTAAGGTRNDIVHVSYGYGLFTGGLGLHYGAEHMGATALPVSSGNTKRQVQLLQDFGSDILCCTPSYAMFIGETVRDMGIDPKTLKLRAGLFGAEPWTDNMRREIERLLDIKAYDIYGLSEIAGPAWPTTARCRTACISMRIISILRSSIRTPSSRCPTGNTASWCSPASARRPCPWYATAPGISAPCTALPAPADGQRCGCPSPGAAATIC